LWKLEQHASCTLFTNLTFRPCIIIYSYNKSQRDALFLNFSTCFGQWTFHESYNAKKLSQHHQRYHVASKMIIFLDTKILLLLWSVNQFSTSASRSGNCVKMYLIKYSTCFGQRTCPKHVVLYQINLGNCASRWLLL